MLKSTISILIANLMLIGLLSNVNSVYSTSVGQEAFAKLTPCQQKCDDIYSIPKANPIDSTNDNLIGCKGGCNILVQEGVSGEIACEERCKQYFRLDTTIAACVKSCMNFADKSVPAIEKPIVTEIKKIEDPKVEVKDVSPSVEVDPVPAILIAKIPEEAKPENKDDSSSSEEEEDKKDDSSSEEEKPEIEVESPIELFKDFFGSELIQGEPQVDKQQQQQQPPLDTKDSDAYLLNKHNDNKDDTQQFIDDIGTPGSSLDSLFSYFDKIKDTFKSAIDKGSYMIRVRMFSNGTVIKEYNELPEGSLPDSILDTLVGNDDANSDISNSNNNNDDVLLPKIFRIQDPFNINDRDSINWKGRPLLVGKPVAIDDANDPMYNPTFNHYRFRECRPISFHFSTLCHDINNLFTCASMKTGLPRWFFLSFVLTTSFLMIWLGIFILSMLRRLRRRERVIQHREEYLPLYKDIDFEVEKGELNSGYVIEAGPLPVKVKPNDV